MDPEVDFKSEFNEERPAQRRRKPVRFSTGYILRGSAPGVPDLNDVVNKKNAAGARVGSKHPVPKLQLLLEFADFVKSEIERCCAPLVLESDVSFEKWIDSMSYPGEKAAKYREAHEMMGQLDDGVTLDQRKIDYCNKVAAFLKDEWYTKKKTPRGIYARRHEIRVLLGPIVKLCEKQVMRMDCFVKYVPVAERAAKVQAMLWRPHAKYYASDFTCFESHFLPLIQDIVSGQFYGHMVQNLVDGPAFMKLFYKTICGTNEISFAGLTAQIKSRRMSGEMDTSLANGLATMLFMRFLAHKSGAEMVGVFEGDDGLMRWDGPDPDPQLIADLGLTLVLEKKDELHLASFCGMIFDPADGGILRDPMPFLVAFGWLKAKYLDFRPGKVEVLIRAKALSMLYQYPTCPVLAPFSRMVLRETTRVSGSGMNRLLTRGYYHTTYQLEQLRTAFDSYQTKEGRNRMLNSPITDGARAIVEELWNVDVAMQRSLEKQFENHSPGEVLYADDFDPYIDTFNLEQFDLFARRKDTVEDRPFPVGLSLVYPGVRYPEMPYRL